MSVAARFELTTIEIALLESDLPQFAVGGVSVQKPQVKRARARAQLMNLAAPQSCANFRRCATTLFQVYFFDDLPRDVQAKDKQKTIISVVCVCDRLLVVVSWRPSSLVQNTVMNLGEWFHWNDLERRVD